MSWSPKIILAANFYGSYLHAEEFDDTVIISDGTIEKLINAAEQRVQIFSKLTDREADLYVFCVIGLTDIIQKSLVGSQYVLQLINNSLDQIERSMYKAVEQLSKYKAKIIWTTTFPISLAKYHRSQGWNVDNMYQFGLSKGMEREQIQLFQLTERLMELCHSFNSRIGQPDFFLIRKVYYSHDGQRELLTHNLLEDGINPTTSVTAEWNIELSKYLQNIRQNRSSGIPSLLSTKFDQPSGYSGGPFPIASGDTLFTFGSSMHGRDQRGLPSLKRQSEQRFDDYGKRSRVDQSFVDKLGRQSEGVQKNLAEGMLNFLNQNLDERGMNQSRKMDLSFASTNLAYQERPLGFQNAGTGRDSFIGKSSVQPGSNQFGSSASYGGNFGSGNSQRFNVRSSGFAPQQPARSFSRPHQSFGTEPIKKNRGKKKKKSKRGSTTSQVAKSSDVPKKDAAADKMSDKPKPEEAVEVTNLESNEDKSKSEPTIPPLVPPSDQKESKDDNQQQASVDNNTVKDGNTPVIKPRSVKERLSTTPNAAKANGSKTAATAVNGARKVTPLLANPVVSRISAKARLSVGSGHPKPGMQASDDFLLSASAGTHQQKRPLLVAPRDDFSHRQVELQYASSRVPQSVMPYSGNFPSYADPMHFQGGPPEDPHRKRLLSMPKGLPSMLYSLKMGDEPSFTDDKHHKRSDYIMIAMKPSDHNARLCRVIADFNDLEKDKLGQVKIGTRRLAVFDKKLHPEDRDIVPSVAFLKTNQWDPGFEKSTAPMTAMQKEVAGFNTALLELMKLRRKLENKLRKNRDPTISLPQKRCVLPSLKLRQLLAEGKNQQSDGASVDKPSTELTATEKSPEKCEDPKQSHMTKADESLNESATDVAEKDCDKPPQVDETEEGSEPAELEDKMDDWTDFDSSNIIIGEPQDLDSAVEDSNTLNEDKNDEAGKSPQMVDHQQPEKDAHVGESADAIAKCFDMSVEQDSDAAAASDAEDTTKEMSNEKALKATDVDAEPELNDGKVSHDDPTIESTVEGSDEVEVKSTDVDKGSVVKEQAVQSTSVCSVDEEAKDMGEQKNAADVPTQEAVVVKPVESTSNTSTEDSAVNTASPTRRTRRRAVKSTK